MKYRTGALLLLVACAAAAAAPLSAETVRNHFDSDAMMRPPGFFDFVVVGSAPARWLVLSDPNPPSAPFRLVQVEKKRPADALAATKDFPGVTGSITMDADRNPIKPAVVLKVDKGRFRFADSIAP